MFDEARAPFLYSYAYTRNLIGPTPGKERVTAYEYLSIIAAFLNVIATYGYLALIYHGIRTMEQTCEKNYGDSERKHAEFMTESARKHDEAMAESRRREVEGIRRHEESMARHDESMAALRELIERTR